MEGVLPISFQYYATQLHVSAVIWDSIILKLRLHWKGHSIPIWITDNINVIKPYQLQTVYVNMLLYMLSPTAMHVETLNENNDYNLSW